MARIWIIFKFAWLHFERECFWQQPSKWWMQYHISALSKRCCIYTAYLWTIYFINFCCRFNSIVPGFTYEDQFLQITTKLPSKNLYGLGEHNHRQFRHNLNWKRWSIFTRDVAPVVSEKWLQLKLGWIPTLWIAVYMKAWMRFCSDIACQISLYFNSHHGHETQTFYE